MKLKVIKTFVDKTDHKTLYETGKRIEISDEQRARDIIARGLAVDVSPKPKQSDE